MLALAVAARVVGRVFVGGAAVRGISFSSMPAVSPSFARVCSVFVTVASLALSQGAVFNEEPTVLERPVMEQALLH